MDEMNITQAQGVRKVDTSGQVMRADPDWPWVEWPDLDPFTQGAVEAALREFSGTYADDEFRLHRIASFSDLSPETLAQIMEDCARFKRDFGRSPNWETYQGGQFFWWDRQEQAERWTINFPPLRLYLADDGKIRIAEEGR